MSETALIQLTSEWIYGRRYNRAAVRLLTHRLWWRTTGAVSRVESALVRRIHRTAERAVVRL